MSRTFRFLSFHNRRLEFSSVVVVVLAIAFGRRWWRVLFVLARCETNTITTSETLLFERIDEMSLMYLIQRRGDYVSSFLRPSVCRRISPCDFWTGVSSRACCPCPLQNDRTTVETLRLDHMSMWSQRFTRLYVKNVNITSQITFLVSGADLCLLAECVHVIFQSAHKPELVPRDPCTQTTNSETRNVTF